jgi:uncharacterized protein
MAPSPILAERPKLSVTPISELRRLAAAAIVATAAVASAAAARDLSFTSPRVAFEQGQSAFRSGYYEIAIPALEHATTTGDAQTRFLAMFFLARIFADNAGTQTDHPKAYMLFQGIADEHGDSDPDDLQRAPIVARSLTSLAGYLQRGVAEIGLKPSAGRAVEYLRHAATFFNDKDAQFEYAKLLLRGDGVQQDPPIALHYLSTLSQDGHPGAQAFLADLHWRGKFVTKDERRALALIKMAVDTAPAGERVWIEDIYQNIYCGTTRDVREQSKGLVATWKRLFAQKPPQPSAAERERMTLGAANRDIGPFRTCANGEPVDINRGASVGADAGGAVKSMEPARPGAITPASGLADPADKPKGR